MPTTVKSGRNDRPVRVIPHRTRFQAVRHTRAFRWIDPHFTHRWRVYLIQSTLASSFLWVILLAQDIILSGAVVAAIAASVAIVFFAPHSAASNPRRIVGGHLSAVVVAYAIVGVGLLLPGSTADAVWFVDLSGAMAVGLVVLLMSITNTEHAPGAATALGLTVRQTPGEAVLFIIAAAMVVAITRIVLGSKLQNLI